MELERIIILPSWMKRPPFIITEFKKSFMLVCVYNFCDFFTWLSLFLKEKNDIDFKK